MGRHLEKRIELDADPEQVWQAVATGPGLSTWFVPHRVDPDDGVITADFGGGNEATGRITAWEPGRRIAYAPGEPPPEGQAAYAFEFLVEGRDGGGTVLRFVQSGFLDGGDWDAEYDSFDAGWDLFFGNLRAYLAHFPGLPVRNAVTMTYTPGSAKEVWPVLHRALGLPGHPTLGDTVALQGPTPVEGVVDVASDGFLGVRSAQGLHRVGAEGDAGCGVSVYHYLYGVDVDAEAVTAAWQSWLEELFPRP